MLIFKTVHEIAPEDTLGINFFTDQVFFHQKELWTQADKNLIFFGWKICTRNLGNG